MNLNGICMTIHKSDKFGLEVDSRCFIQSAFGETVTIGTDLWVDILKRDSKYIFYFDAGTFYEMLDKK